MQIRKVTGEELEVALANREKPMIVDFYADWCGPCVLLAKELEQVRENSSNDLIDGLSRCTVHRFGCIYSTKAVLLPGSTRPGR